MARQPPSNTVSQHRRVQRSFFRSAEFNPLPGRMCFQAGLHVLARSGINSALLWLRLKPPCALSCGQLLLPGQRFSKTKQVLRQFKPLPAGTPRATCSAPRPGTIRFELFQFHAPAIRRTAAFRATAPGRPDHGYRLALDFSGGPM